MPFSMEINLFECLFNEDNPKKEDDPTNEDDPKDEGKPKNKDAPQNKGQVFNSILINNDFNPKNNEFHS